MTAEDRGLLLAAEAIVRASSAPRAQHIADRLHALYETCPQPEEEQ